MEIKYSMETINEKHLMFDKKVVRYFMVPLIKLQYLHALMRIELTNFCSGASSNKDRSR